MLRTSGFRFGIRQWFHDATAQQHLPGLEDTLRKIGELARKNTAQSSPHRRQHIPVEHRSDVNRTHCCEQYSASGKRVWQSSALASPTKILNTRSALIGGDIEPSEEPREDVEMENDEIEEPSEVPRGRANPRNPTRRESEECAARHFGRFFPR